MAKNEDNGTGNKNVAFRIDTREVTSHPTKEAEIHQTNKDTKQKLDAVFVLIDFSVVVSCRPPTRLGTCPTVHIIFV